MKKYETKKLDTLAKKMCRDDYGKCVVCGKVELLNAHHVEGCDNRATRWYQPNLVALCPEHHMLGNFSAHKSPLRMRKMFIEIFGLKWEKDLINQANKTFKGNYQQVLDYLENKIDNYC